MFEMTGLGVFLVNKKRRCIKTKFFVINNKDRNGIGSVEQ